MQSPQDPLFILRPEARDWSDMEQEKYLHGRKYFWRDVIAQLFKPLPNFQKSLHFVIPKKPSAPCKANLINKQASNQNLIDVSYC